VRRYKYDPVILKSILFPDSEGDRPPPKKRRRIEKATDVESDSTALPLPYAGTRPVILETAKESYLLSPSTPGNGDGSHKYDIALILEAELEEELVPEVNFATTTLPGLPTGPQSADSAKDDSHTLSAQPLDSGPHNSTLEGQPSSFLSHSKSTIPPHINATTQSTASPMLPLNPLLIASLSSEHQQSAVTDPPPHPASSANVVPKEAAEPLTKAPELSSPPRVPPSSRRPSLVHGDALSTKPLLLQALQRHLGEEMFQFLKEGVKVADNLSEDGIQTEWMVQVKRWKWGGGPVTS